VDIFDITAKKWSKAELSNAKRDGMVVASVGNKVLFAGGGDNDWVDVTSTVDIYDAGSNTWSTAELSEGRNYLTAATLGDRVFFAGGGIWGPLANPGLNYHVGSKRVDIYDNSSNTWSTASLSEGRFELSSAVAGKRIYFSGGINDIFTISKRIDIYDSETGSWSVSELKEGKASHAGIVMDDKLLWVAGSTSPYQSGYSLSNQVEINDLSTGVTTFECIRPKAMFSTVITNDEVIFFTGFSRGSGKYFDVYNKNSRSWSVGVLPVEIHGSAVISAGNAIYIAGGKVDGAYSDQVWILEL
jgi:N-acetylneuraminic acid mutarotase